MNTIDRHELKGVNHGYETYSGESSPQPPGEDCQFFTIDGLPWYLNEFYRIKESPAEIHPSGVENIPGVSGSAPGKETDA